MTLITTNNLLIARKGKMSKTGRSKPWSARFAFFGV
jgi:hypothetical protein